MNPIYHYDPLTGEYLYQGEADPSPLEEDVWLTPAYATTKPKPETGIHEAVLYLDANGKVPSDHTLGDWIVKADWRGIPLWSTATGEPVSIEEFGVTPADIGATDIEPLPHCVWDGAAWKEDAALRTKHLVERRSAKQAEINAAAGRTLNALSASYPDGEVSSWSQQTKEADILETNPNATAPLLTAIATARGMNVTDLASRIRAKATAYAVASGRIIGQRQALEDALNAIDLKAADADTKLEAIQWPAT